MAVSEQAARAELARRELARRREALPTISEPVEPPVTQLAGFRPSDPVSWNDVQGLVDFVSQVGGGDA